MGLTRRSILAMVAGGITTGCLNGGNGPGASPTTEPGGGEPSPTVGSCDPAEVTRPPIIEDADHPPKGYGTKPQELTPQSVADYLADFETALAWNRLLSEHDTLTNIGVNTLTPWSPAAAGTGYIASSEIETSYATEADGDPTERTYVASYFVAAGPVFRVETASEPVDPRTHRDRQLVQCGPDTKQ